MKEYGFVALKVKAETQRKVRVAAALAGMDINEWVERMATRALEETLGVSNLPAISIKPADSPCEGAGV